MADPRNGGPQEKEAGTKWFTHPKTITQPTNRTWRMVLWRKCPPLVSVIIHSIIAGLFNACLIINTYLDSVHVSPAERRQKRREERVLLPPAPRVYKSGLAAPVCDYVLKRADASDKWSDCWSV